MLYTSQDYSKILQFYLHDAVYLYRNTVRFTCMMLSTCTCVRSIRLSLKVIQTSETVTSFTTRALGNGLLVRV